MKVLRGKLVDHQLKMHQFANDWVTVSLVHCPFDDDGDGNCKRCARVQVEVINPLNIELDSAEEAAEWKTHLHAGFFWQAYELGEDRRFHPKVRYDQEEHRGH